MSKAFTKVVTCSGVLALRGRPVDFSFNADPVAPKLVTHNKIVFRAATGSRLLRLKCIRSGRCVEVTDSFCFDKRLHNESATLTSLIHGSKRKKAQFMAAKETKNNKEKNTFFVSLFYFPFIYPKNAQDVS